MNLWVEKMLEVDNPTLFELSEDLLYKYAWLCFKEKINKTEKLELSYKDKLNIKPAIPRTKSEKSFKKLSDSLSKDNNKLYKFNIEFIDRFLQPMSSQFMVFAARHGGGKTYILLRYALNLAKAGVKTLYISLEMGEAQIRSRIASAFSRF